MAGFRKSIWAAAALLALPAPAFAQDLCAALNRIEAASRESKPFASLAGAGARGDLMPGFGEEDCRLRAGGVSCYRHFAPQVLDVSAMERTMRDCLRRDPVSRLNRPGFLPERELVFVASGLRYRVANSCDSRCRAGLLAYFEVTLEAARAVEQ